MKSPTENNGSSYMLFTLAAGAFGTIAVLMDQQINTKGSHVWFTIVGVFFYVINLIGIVSLFWREWISQTIEISPSSRTSQLRIPWRIYRVIDHYLGLNLSFSLVLMIFWVWNQDTYYAFSQGINSTNHWTAWLAFIGTSFSMYNGVGVVHLNVASSGSGAVITWHIMLSRIINMFVFVTVIGEGVSFAKQKRRDAQVNNRR